MRKAQLKIWLLSIGGAIVAVFLIYHGFKLLFRPNDASDWQLFFLGVGCVLTSVFTLAAQVYVPKKYKISGALMFLGIYFFARATGIIEGAWFMRFLGLASLIGAGLIVYVTYLGGKKIHF